MLKKSLIALAATGVLLAPAAAATAVPTGAERGGSSIEGKWKGGVYGDAGAAAGYSAKVKIVKKQGTLKAKISYPKYGCTGTWKFKGKSGGTYKFVEKIKSGPCVDNVKVTAKRDGGKLAVTWTEPSSGDHATMKASKA